MNAPRPQLDDAYYPTTPRGQPHTRARPVEGDEASVLIALGRLAVAGKRRAFVSAQEVADWLVGAPPLDERAVADALLLLAQRGLADSSTALHVPPVATARFRLTQAGVAAICQQSVRSASSPADPMRSAPHGLRLVFRSSVSARASAT